MALFSVLTPFAGKRQDDYQIYRSALLTSKDASVCAILILLRQFC